MGRLTVFASGSGSNFEAICSAFSSGPHSVVGLVCDRPNARVLTRAERLAVPSALVLYRRRGEPSRRAAEERIREIVKEMEPDLIALAGFMRILSPGFVAGIGRAIVNVHPALLPRHAGLDAIRRSFESEDERLGITVHFVDDGVDTGPVIRQERIRRREGEVLAEAEKRIHALEHRVFPAVLAELLSTYDDTGNPAE